MQASIDRPAILFVDDEAASRDMAIRVLAKAGFDVLTACDGVEAVKYLRSRPEIRGIISDIRMPRLNGLQLALIAQDMHPETKVALITAYMDEAARLADMDRWPVWIKPFDIDRLASLAEELCRAQ